MTEIVCQAYATYLISRSVLINTLTLLSAGGGGGGGGGVTGYVDGILNEGVD